MGSNSNVLSGAAIFVEGLRRAGVEVIFGYPGGAVLALYDELYRSGIRHILTRHEQGAVHAADGYARSSGRVGVCLATSGPGATNLVTGLANAMMDSVPVVAFTGQVATSAIGRDSFQEADITGITVPITKHNYQVRNVRDLPDVMTEAFYLARSGRPGPVLVDLPKDVTTAEIAADKVVWPQESSLAGYRLPRRGAQRQIRAAVRALVQARRPLLYVGGGVAGTKAALACRSLAEELALPAASTLMGLGVIPAQYPLYLGMLGMHGTVAANRAMAQCDVLLAVGARFDDRVTGKLEAFAPHAIVIHVDIDAAEIGKNVRVHIPIVGDAGAVLEEMLRLLPEYREGAYGPKGEEDLARPWRLRVLAWKRQFPVDAGDGSAGPGNSTPAGRSAGVGGGAGPAMAAEAGTGPRLRPQTVIQAVAERVPDQHFVVTDVGQHQMWAAQLWPVSRPRSFISSGGLGTMGFGLPAAVGVQVAHPGARVVLLSGDGSIQMNIQELGTVASERLPIKIVILNNEYLGMVRQWQELFYDRRYSQTHLSNPDFAAIARAYGLEGYRVSQAEELGPVLDKALASPQAALIDVAVAPEENVYPFIPAGGSVKDMIVGPSGPAQETAAHAG